MTPLIRAVAGLTSGMVVVDRDGVLQTMNPAARRILGLDPDDVVRHGGFEPFVHPGEPCRHQVSLGQGHDALGQAVPEQYALRVEHDLLRGMQVEPFEFTGAVLELRHLADAAAYAAASA